MARLTSSAGRQALNRGNDVGVIRVPQGVDLWKATKAGQVRMAILPYTVQPGARGLPDGIKPGDQYYQRDFFVHAKFGETGKDYAICPKATFGDKCPICEARKQVYDSGDKERGKQLAPKQRTLFNVYLPEEKKVVLWETSFHLFTKILYQSVAAKMQIPGMESADYFADPVEGSFLYVSFKEESLNGFKFFEAVSVDFVPHKGLEKSILDQAMPLDDLLIVDSYEGLYARFWDADPVSAEQEGAEVELPEDVPVVKETAPVVQEQPPSSQLVEQAVKAPEAPAAEKPAAPLAPKAPKAEKDLLPSWLVKGVACVHKTIGKVTVYKIVDGVITVMDANDDSHKVKAEDLLKPGPAAPVAEPPADVQSDGDADAWDADWKQD